MRDSSRGSICLVEQPLERRPPHPRWLHSEAGVECRLASAAAAGLVAPVPRSPHRLTCCDQRPAHPARDTDGVEPIIANWLDHDVMAAALGARQGGPSRMREDVRRRVELVVDGKGGLQPGSGMVAEDQRDFASFFARPARPTLPRSRVRCCTPASANFRGRTQHWRPGYLDGIADDPANQTAPLLSERSCMFIPANARFTTRCCLSHLRKRKFADGATAISGVEDRTPG
jgi:hypothetical protein